MAEELYRAVALEPAPISEGSAEESDASDLQRDQVETSNHAPSEIASAVTLEPAAPISEGSAEESNASNLQGDQVERSRTIRLPRTMLRTMRRRNNAPSETASSVGIHPLHNVASHSRNAEPAIEEDSAFLENNTNTRFRWLKPYYQPRHFLWPRDRPRRRIVLDRPRVEPRTAFKLQTVKFTETQLNEEQCTICLTSAREYKLNWRPVARTSCGHLFCVPCIYCWRKESLACPICRRVVLRPEDRGLILFHII
ncbi:hypothetical protein JTE90_027985 [Oedothorax gibbosus]|uniref:RING-type domain-containing protein n=1 Tax=Oedothorax gibbosus TaxID=931172 RepID=A0AAV6TJW8_9ARAC|nr:hypothetical protein JTE90_027985 [Oedothorax gibbosus]